MAATTPSTNMKQVEAGRGVVAPCSTQYYSYWTPWDDLPVGYLPCPHQHFKTESIDRSKLKREDHIALLATPRGYRWLASAELEQPKPYAVSRVARKRARDAKKLFARSEQRYIHDFLADIWSLMSPELIEGLKKILIDEFGMSITEAENFIFAQSEVLEKTKKKGSIVDLEIRSHWLKQFRRLLASKLADYIVSRMSARRTKRTRLISEEILRHMCDLTGERCTLNNPQNQVQRLQVFVADRIASWLSQAVAESDKELCTELKLAQGDTDGAVGTMRRPERRPRKPKKSGAGEGTEEGGADVRPESKPDSGPRSKVVSKPASGVVSGARSKGTSGPASKEASKPESKVASGPGSKVASGPGSKVASTPMSLMRSEPRTPDEGAEGDVGGSEVELAEGEVGTPAGDAEDDGNLGEGEEDEGGPMGTIEDMIGDTEPGDSDREADLASVLEDQLKDELGQLSPEEQTALEAVAEKTGSFVDALLKEAEGDVPVEPIPPPVSKDVTFHIRKGSTGCYYDVKRITDQRTICDKTILGRSSSSRPVAPKEICVRPPNADPMKPGKADLKKWAEWAANVTTFAEQWASWIDKVCREAEEKAKSRKTGDKAWDSDWRKWQKETRESALEYIRNKKYLKQTEAVWNEKLQKMKKN